MRYHLLSEVLMWVLNSIWAGFWVVYYVRRSNWLKRLWCCTVHSYLHREDSHDLPCCDSRIK